LNPTGWILKQIYDEADKRNEKLQPINEQNRLFYEGVDQWLEDRANDPNVARSSIFIPLLKPAIDTRISDPVTRLHERKHPITLTPTNAMASTQEREHINKLEAELDRQLRECGYLPSGFAEHLQGAEIYRTPSAVKIGWQKVYEKQPVVKVDTIKLWGMNTGIPKGKRVEFKTVEVGRPYVEWLFPDEFLYQPNRSRFDDTDYRYPSHVENRRPVAGHGRRIRLRQKEG